LEIAESGRRKPGGLKAQLRDIDRGRRGSVIKEVPDECADRKTSLSVDSIVDQM